jgi:hypothetical protein
MAVVQKVVELYMESRNIRRIIQKKIKAKDNIDSLVQSDNAIIGQIKSLCDNVQIRILHKKLAIILDNEDYESCEYISKRIEELSER